MAGTSDNQLPFNSQALMKAGLRDGKQAEWRIEGVRGLILVVKPSGVATWFYKYTVHEGGKRKFRTVKIGRRDGTTLGDARRRAEELRHEIEDGTDVAKEAETKAAAEKAKAEAFTLRGLFEARCEADGERAERTLHDYRQALELDVFPVLGDLPAAEITADQIADVLERVEARSKHSAHRARSALGSTYRWAVRRRKAGIRVNPTVGLAFTYQGPPRERVLSDAELATLWRGLDAGHGLSEPLRIILKLCVLTGQRESEVAGARRDELRLDGDRPLWRIAGTRTVDGERVEGRMKAKREQIVPLVPSAVALFRRALELGRDREWVFPAETARLTGERARTAPRKPHINGESVSRAMARLRDKIGLEDARVHDLRKTITTWLREAGVSRDVCDLILHHAKQGVTGSHYDFSTLEGPVRRALEVWASHLQAVFAGNAQAAAGNVVAFKPAVA